MSKKDEAIDGGILREYICIIREFDRQRRDNDNEKDADGNESMKRL